ncbi:galactokinase [Lysinibacter sp. HNR]|uniref:galactokinase n=1 Tax=Lysinibacter sp. HNR TaxID=3031408 RepID=UPI0024354A81|nr:galactokinase [Lysinibacter sp. HNR]WGD38671.1 galactokinase [Lysinibacter sp. HNR]
MTENEATGIWSAPGRVNLIGEHTDYNNGFVLPLAINQQTWAAVRLRTDSLATVTSGLGGTNPTPVTVDLRTLTPAQLEGWAAYPLGVAWALSEFGADLSQLPGFDLHLESNVPVGAGLSSSAAIECATAVALNELWQLGLDRQTLARVGQRAENVVVGAPTGIMDQVASLYGEVDHAVFLDCQTLEATAIPLGLAEAGLELLVIDTTVAHSHSTGGYASRRQSCEQGASLLGVTSLREVSVADLPRAEQLLDDTTFRRVRHVVTENQRVLDSVSLFRSSGPSAIGEFLNASHLSMRDDFEISIPELDLAVEVSARAGAVGSRMTGGGFGGSAIALVPSSERERITEVVLEAFAGRGFARPNVFAVSAGAGAGRTA